MAIGAPQIQQRNPFVGPDLKLTTEALGILNDSFAQLYDTIVVVANLAGVTIPGLDSAIASANAAAVAANTAAAAANSAATQASSDSALATSGVSGLTMTAFDAGSDASISISSHTRIYGDGTSVAVSGGSITGLLYSSAYYVYYSDPARSGGTVTFLASLDPNDAVQTGDVNSLGGVNTPAPAGSPIIGVPNLPPGVVQP